MQGHLPGPPQPHVPEGLAPFIGYLATREPRPLDERVPYEPAWPRRGSRTVGPEGGLEVDERDIDDDVAEVGDWEPMHRGAIRALAVVVSLALLVGAVGTVLEVLLASH